MRLESPEEGGSLGVLLSLGVGCGEHWLSGGGAGLLAGAGDHVAGAFLALGGLDAVAGLGALLLVCGTSLLFAASFFPTLLGLDTVNLGTLQGIIVPLAAWREGWRGKSVKRR